MRKIMVGIICLGLIDGYAAFTSANVVYEVTGIPVTGDTHASAYWDGQYGSKPIIQRNVYLQWDLPSNQEIVRVESATVRMLVSKRADNRDWTFRRVEEAFDEHTLTHANAPAVSAESVVHAVPEFTLGRNSLFGWFEFDVSDLLELNGDKETFGIFVGITTDTVVMTKTKEHSAGWYRYNVATGTESWRSEASSPPGHAAAQLTATYTVIGELPTGELLNGDFEEGLAHWSVPSWFDGLTPQLDAEIFHGVGTASLRLDGEPGKRGHVRQQVALPPGQDRALRLAGWIRTRDFENKWVAGIQVAYDTVVEGTSVSRTHGSTTSWQHTYVDWERHEVDFVLPDDVAELRVILYTQWPSSTAGPNRGSAWFDKIELVTWDPDEPIPPPLLPETIELLNFFPVVNEGLVRPDEAAAFTVEVANHGEEAADIDVRYTVRDFERREVESGHIRHNVAAGMTIPIPLVVSEQDQPGFYAVEVSLQQGARPEQQRISSFVVTVPREHNDPFFGLNGIILGDRMARPAADIGVGSVGLSLEGNSLYRNGSFDFAGSDQRYEAFSGQGIELIGQVWTRPSRAIPSAYRSEDLMFDFYEDFLDQLVSHFLGRIHKWHFVQEIDLAMQRDPAAADTYIDLIRSGSTGARRADPDSILYGVGVSGEDSRRLPRHQVVRQLWPHVNDYLDGLAFDCYVNPKIFGPGRTTVGPERGGLIDILEDAWSIMREHGKERLAIGEKGNAILTALPVDSPYAKDMAKVIARHLIVAKAMGVDHYLYFTVTGSRWHGNDDYGLWKREIEDGQYVDNHFHPRPAVATYATTAHLLAHTETAHRVELHDDIWIYAFEKGDGAVVALWSVSQAPVTLNFDFPAAAPVYDIMERHVDDLSTGANRLVLTDAPLFVTVDRPATEVVALLSAAWFSLPELQGELSIATDDVLRLHLRNMTNDEVTGSARLGTAQVALGEQSFQVDAGTVATLDFAVPQGVRSLVGTQVTARAVTGESVLEFATSFVPVFVPRLLAGTDLAAVQEDAPTITLSGISHLFPDDAAANQLWTGDADLSADLWFRWDEANFYIVAAVTDDVHVQNRQGAGMWANDSLQFAFDIGNNALSPVFAGRMGYDGEDDYEFTAGLTAEGPQLYCHLAPEGNPLAESLVTGLPAFSIERDDEAQLTLYRIAIPWALLEPMGQGEAGAAFGFNLCIPDSDDGRTASYWMGITEGILGGKDPSLFRTFVLE